MTKVNLALLSGTTMLLSAVAPALAQTTAANATCDKTAVKISQAGPRQGRLEHREEAGRFGHFRHHRGAFSALKGDAALTDAQYEKIFNIKESFRDQLGPKLAGLFSTKREMKDLMTQPNLDKSKIESLEAKLDNERSSISDLKLQEKLNVISVLTDQQRQVIREHFVKAVVNGRAV